jgi:oligoendopeptidase F
MNDTLTWNLSSLYKSDDDPKLESDQKIIARKVHSFVHKWQKRDDYLKKPNILKEALDDFEALMYDTGTSGNLGYYLWLRTHQDQNDPKLKALYAKMVEFSTKLGNELEFFHLNISKIPKSKQSQFLNYKGLLPYRHYLKRSFAESKFLLSEPEEKILNLKSFPAHGSWVKMTSTFISKEEREVLGEDGQKSMKTFEEILNLTQSKEKAVRDEAAAALNEIFAKFIEVAEHEINAVLTNKKIDDDLRKIERPDLPRHISDDIDSEVVDTLLETVSSHFGIARRYYQLKAKVMGVEKLAYHERNVEVGELKGKWSFEESAKLVENVFQKLDPEFADIFRGYLKNGQIDVHPRKGKYGGAFCIHNLPSQLTFVLLNHTDNLRNVLTLAHELGHGINNELVKASQNSLNVDTPLSTAEVASTFMEDFVLEELLKESTDEERFALLMMKLNEDVSTIFRQVSFYLFEQELHQKHKTQGFVSKELIGELFQKHTGAYMGKAVEQSSGSENWWIYVSHFRSFFYVYSYASGLLISKSLQKSVKENPKFIKKMKQFLSDGTSDSPKNIFKRLHIDITNPLFWEGGLDEIENTLKMAEKLAKKLGKI